MPSPVRLLNMFDKSAHLYDLAYSFKTTSRVDGSQSILDMHYLVASPSGIEHLVETHRMTLFTLSEYESAFLASNLTFEFDQVGPIGRGALIGQASQNRLQRSTVLPIGR